MTLRAPSDIEEARRWLAYAARNGLADAATLSVAYEALAELERATKNGPGEDA